MKKSKTFFACAILVTLASCSNDHVLHDYTINEKAPIEISTSIGGVDVLTKAAANVYGSGSHFDAETKVNVYIFEHVEAEQTRAYNYGTDGKVVYTSNGDGVLTASPTNYFPGNGHGIDIYGIYPTSIEAKNESQTFEVQTDQSNDKKYKDSDLMFAAKKTDVKKDNTLKLTFAHQLSKVIVKLKQGKGLKDTDLNDATITILNTKPECTIESVDADGMNNITASGDAKEITVGTWNSPTEGLAAIVVPQTINASTALIQVKLSNNAVYTYKPSNNVTFVPGNQHTFTLTLSTTEISVNAEISDWEEGTGDNNGSATL